MADKYSNIKLSDLKAIGHSSTVMMPSVYGLPLGTLVEMSGDYGVFGINDEYCKSFSIKREQVMSSSLISGNGMDFIVMARRHHPGSGDYVVYLLRHVESDKYIMAHDIGFQNIRKP